MSKTILLVDDDQDYLEQMKVQIEAAGYNVAPAGSVAEATKLLDTQQFDAAVVDLMLEDVDGGFTLCYRIKRKHAGVPVLLVTGVSSETGIDFDAATNEERSWVKADVVLNKPVRFEQLQRELSRLLKD